MINEPMDVLKIQIQQKPPSDEQKPNQVPNPSEVEQKPAQVPDPSDAATHYSAVTPATVPGSSDDSAPGSPIKDSKYLAKLKADEKRICELEKLTKQWMLQMTVADAIANLEPREYDLMRRAHKIRNSIKNMEEDPELQPLDESSVDSVGSK